MVEKEVQQELDGWYTQYYKINRRFPTWEELVKKAQEIKNELGLN